MRAIVDAEPPRTARPVATAAGSGPGPKSQERRRRAVALCALLWLAAGCGGSGRPAPPGPAQGPSLAAWAEGPVSWLLLPRERKELRRIDSSVESVYFIEDFWQRRDPDSSVAGNPVRATFNQRVDAADQLYPERGRRGSLTDRGGALILLGSPSHLHVTSRPALNWDPRGKRGDRVRSQRQGYEIWGYRLEDLPPALTEAVRGRRNGDPVKLQLKFAQGKDRTYLVEGGDLLELAARVMAGQGPRR